MDAAHRRRDSETTLASLRQLDPSPIESPDVERNIPDLEAVDDEEDYGSLGNSSTSTIKPGSISSVGLSGSGQGAIYYLTRIQKYSSYAMSIFTTLHLTNVSLIPFATGSVDASETYLLMTRELYQTTITEPIVVALPVIAHVGSGIALRLLRRSQNIKRYGGSMFGSWSSLQRSSSSDRTSRSRSKASPWPPLSFISMSGYAFTLAYSAHVFMNRVIPVLYEGDSSNVGLAYVAHGFARHPIISRLAYIGLITISCSHMVWGATKWLGQAPSTRGLVERQTSDKGSIAVVDKKTRKQRRRKWAAIHGVALAYAALWAAGGLGVVGQGGASTGWVGKLYDDLFARIRL